MALPLIAMAVLGGVRMATPAVAKYLAKQGFKKASKSAVKKTPNAPKINMTQARSAAKPKASDVASKKVKPVKPVTGAAKAEMLKAAGKRASEAGKSKYKGPVIGSATKPKYKGPVIGSATKPKGLNMPGSAKPATKPKGLNMPSRAKPGSSKIPASKTNAKGSSLIGSPTQKALAATAGLSTITAIDSKLKPKSKPKSNIADVKRKPTLPKVEVKPKNKKPAPKKPVRSGTGRGNMAGKNMGSESVSEYFGDMQGRKTKVRLPFGMGTVDVDSTKSAYDNDESVEMGQKKGGRMTTVRRRMGGKVRGYGKAMRGY